METTKAILIGTDIIISIIKEARNMKIDELSDETNLLKFLEENFNTIAISKVKKEFLLKDLSQLKHSPLDLAHYAPLIKKMKELNQSAIDNPKLIMSEISAVVTKYVQAIS